MPGKGLGGKRRTLTAQCGKVIQGNPERLSVLVRLHTKCCASCQADRAMANSVGQKFQRDNLWRLTLTTQHRDLLLCVLRKRARQR